MKKTLIAVLLSFSGLATSAYANDELTISQLAVGQDTKAEFQKMKADKVLPEWVTQGGTGSPGQKVSIAGHQYLVLTSCKHVVRLNSIPFHPAVHNRAHQNNDVLSGLKIVRFPRYLIQGGV
ncbi:inhibitor of vertebrate lysozyme [Escherichia coli TA206]|uniref:Ivy family c-type lysozyme inhibitor n=1 Tax=Escherichia coli TaxID=562 RepID=UPI0001E8AA6F|nr:Ivy family c-type lysozyme inhibitor [Escherichia coli]EGI25827.1 inhibitor of vertebrate lysozyme [Escherichia coli TA206]